MATILFVCRAYLGSFCYGNESVRYHGNNLDMRKNSYASKAHEAAAMRKMSSAINWVIFCAIIICPVK